MAGSTSMAHEVASQIVLQCRQGFRSVEAQVRTVPVTRHMMWNPPSGMQGLGVFEPLR